ncbi:MAG TPA: DUF3043 domain-containing protein [Aldersonia sp.]
MRLLRRGNTDNPDDSSSNEAASTEQNDATTAETAGKGRPTPTRREAEGKRRGPVAPAPMTRKEARERSKANKGTKEERKAASAARRSDAAERRARMLAGEEKYLLPRDKGKVRGLARDMVDSRRHLVGMFMPFALVLIMTMFLTPQIQQFVTLAMLVMMAFMGLEGYLLGRRVNRAARERYPDNTESGFKLGWYAFVRASQLRKMRAPKPRVAVGDAV